MKIEYEATFPNIDKDEIRERLKKSGAVLVRPEFLQKRITLNLPKGHEIEGGWLRVRDEGNRLTMTLKVINGNQIQNQKEILLKVDNFDSAVYFLETLGCTKKSYQENKREVWNLDGVEVDIDEWPFLETYIEIEGESEEEVSIASEKLGLDYAEAFFGMVTTLYSKKYGVSEDLFNNQIKRLTFEGKNPFIS